MTHEQSSDRVR